MDAWACGWQVSWAQIGGAPPVSEWLVCHTRLREGESQPWARHLRPRAGHGGTSTQRRVFQTREPIWSAVRWPFVCMWMTYSTSYQCDRAKHTFPVPFLLPTPPVRRPRSGSCCPLLWLPSSLPGLRDSGLVAPPHPGAPRYPRVEPRPASALPWASAPSGSVRRLIWAMPVNTDVPGPPGFWPLTAGPLPEDPLCPLCI